MVQAVQAVQMNKREIIAVKEYALRKRHDELYGGFLKYFECKMMDYHTLMNSYETTLDLLVQLLSLEGLSPSEIAGKIRDVADHTDSFGQLKKELLRSLDAFDTKALLRFPDNRIDHTPPSSAGTQNMEGAGVRQ